YFSERILEARNFSKSCEVASNLSEDDSLRCKMASQVVNDELKRLKYAKRKEQLKEDFYADISKARKLLDGKCKTITRIMQNDISEDSNIECRAATEVVEEDTVVKSRLHLIDKIKVQLKPSDLSDKEKLRAEIYRKK